MDPWYTRSSWQAFGPRLVRATLQGVRGRQSSYDSPRRCVPSNNGRWHAALRRSGKDQTRHCSHLEISAQADSRRRSSRTRVSDPSSSAVKLLECPHWQRGISKSLDNDDYEHDSSHASWPTSYEVRSVISAAEPLLAHVWRRRHLFRTSSLFHNEAVSADGRDEKRHRHAHATETTGCLLALAVYLGGGGEFKREPSWSGASVDLGPSSPR